MADPLTANKFLAQPLRGSDIGVWDTPMNANTGIIDNSFGGLATIPLTNSNVVLSAAQYQNIFLVLTGALSASVALTLPAVGSIYTVQNLTTNTSAFQVTLLTTAAGGQAIGCPWGEAFDILTDGTNVKYRNFGRVATYWDYGGSSVPAWVTACTVPPYLNCDGTSFSSATFPILATILGGTTLPDSKGRTRFTLGQGSGRITSSGGLDGTTLLAGGGVQLMTLTQTNLPSMTVNITDPGHTHDVQGGDGSVGGVGFITITSNTLSGRVSAAAAKSNTTGITAGSTGNSTPFGQVPPGYVGGITMVRAG